MLDVILITRENIAYSHIGNSLQPFVKRIHSHESRNNHVNAVCEQYDRGKKVLDPVSIKCWQGMRKDGCSTRKLAKFSNVARKFGYVIEENIYSVNFSLSFFSLYRIQEKTPHAMLLTNLIIKTLKSNIKLRKKITKFFNILIFL